MNIFSMAVKNLKKNFSFYFLYLMSVTLVITVFFAFTSFSVNQVILEKISQDGRVETMCNTVSVFLMAFVVFYMAFSNRFFLRRRTKELGIYALMGYRKSQILGLLTIENVCICGMSLLLGILSGAVLHKGIVAGITGLLHLSVESWRIPLFSIRAAVRTVGFILLTAGVLAVSNGRFLIKTTLMDLVRFEKSSEPRMKFRKIPAFLGFAMALTGYVLAADILRGADSLWITVGFYQTGLITMFFTVLGTVLFIASFLPYIIQKSRENRQVFYRDTTIITTPNFIYRIRSNAKTLIMLTLLSAAALTVSGVMALSLYYPIAAVSRMAPSELEFRIEQKSQERKVRELVEKSVAEGEDVAFTRTDIYKVPASAENLPQEYSIGTAKGDADNEKIVRKAGFECISGSDYLALLRAQGRGDVSRRFPVLQDEECVLVKYQPNSDRSDESGDIYTLHIGTQMVPVTVKRTTMDNAVSFANSIGTLIVSDKVYGLVKASGLQPISIMSINGEAVRDNEALYSKISSLLEDSPYLQGNSHRIQSLFSLNSSTFLLIGFLVVLFFIAVGSILYFNNISAVSDSEADYDILWKMGYADNKIRKIIKNQVRTFFCIPFLLGLMDCIFATMVYKAGLMQNLLGSSVSQYAPVFIAVVLTAVIYGIYYCITVQSCCKIVLK